MQGIWIEIRKIRGTRVIMQEIKMENLGIAVKMTQNSNGHDKFKEWKEVKITENEHICKKLVPRI